MTKKALCPKCKHEPHASNACNERVCDAAGDIDDCPCGVDSRTSVKGFRDFMAPAMKLATPRVRRAIRIAIEKAVETNPWQRAVEEACIVSHIDFCPNDARATLANLINWEVQTALDPKVSEAAYNLLMTTPPDPPKFVTGIRVPAEMLRDANFFEVRVDWSGKEWKYCDMCHDAACPWCYQTNWRTCPRCGGHAVIEDVDWLGVRWWWACAKCKLDVSRWREHDPRKVLRAALSELLKDELEELVLDGELKRSQHKKEDHRV